MANNIYEIIVTEKFEKDLKYYYKKKNYRHIQEDIQDIIDKISHGDFVGDEITNLKLGNSNHTFKVRAANTDANVGQSNGYRIIYYVVKDDYEVYLLTIYSKKDDIKIVNNQEIAELIETYCL